MFEFIENIPQIPEELLLYDIDQITKNQNKFGYKEAYVTYSTYDVSPELYDFLNA